MSPCLRLCASTLGFVAVVAALSNVQAPSSPAPDANVTVTWSSDSSDTTPLTLALFSSDTNQTYPGGLAVANNVNPQSNQASILFPQVIPGSYTLSFIDASNTSNVLASSPAFSVAAAAASSSAPAASSSRTGSTTATAPGSSASSSLSAARSSISGSLSSAASSISHAASSAASSAQSAASSALSHAASGASSSVPSPSASTGGASSLRSPSLALVLGWLALGVAV